MLGPLNPPRAGRAPFLFRFPYRKLDRASRPVAATLGSTDDESARTTLEELKRFLGFLRSLWGVLAGITVLFPLSNSLMAVLPLLPGSEVLSTVLATLFSAFALFFVFVLRGSGSNDDIGSVVLLSIGSLVFGIVALIAYLYLRLQPLAFGVVPVLYGGVFALFTLAFGLLALVEYERQTERHPKDFATVVVPRESPEEMTTEEQEL